MDYTKIISRSWEIVKHNRFLWWLGILAGFGGMGSGFRGYNMGSSRHSSRMDDPAFEHMVNNVQNWASNNAGVLLWLAVLSVILFIALLYISYTAQAGLILSTNDIEHNKKKLSFREAYRSGRPYSWRMFGLGLALGVLMLATVLVCIMIGISLTSTFAFSETVDGMAVAFGILLFMVFLVGVVVLVVMVALLQELAQRIIVLENTDVNTALTKAKELLFYEFTNTLVSWLINSVVISIASVAVALVFLVVAGILVAVGVVSWAASPMFGLAYTMVALIAAAIGLFAAGGIMTAYRSVYWTLSYQAIAYLADHKKKKSKE